MDSDNKHTAWLKDFESFLKEEGAQPPHALSHSLMEQVRADLNPSLPRVSVKLFGLHVFGAGVVSLFCPQLGVGPILGGDWIMPLFMHYGPLACAALCGALFLGVSALLATFLLSLEELRVANRYRFLNVTLLASLSFAGLMLAGGSSDRLSYAFWILGAVVTGWLVLTAGSVLRLKTAG